MIARPSLALALAVLASGCRSPATSDEVRLASAASLRGVVPELARAFEASHPGAHVTSTFGASGALERQIEAGAPVDAVLFAAKEPAARLVEKGRVDASSLRVLATNELVLIAPGGSRALTFATIHELREGERLALGDPESVPAGQYARAYLTSIGAWDALAGKLVYASDVAAVLAYARRGEVLAAIVYSTDARGVADVVVEDRCRGGAAPKPEVVSALVTNARGAATASAFLSFAASPEGQAIFASFGFLPPE